MGFLEKYKRTHHCQALTAKNVGEDVILMGWVQTRRDHGGLIFVDLRDHHGLTQVVFNPQIDAISHQGAHKLRSEYVLGVRGKVSPRPEGMRNPKLYTGEIEILIDEFEIFNASLTPPFLIEDEIFTNETTRLKYRYLDLRRRPLQQRLIFRSRFNQVTRTFFSEREFYELETPTLTKSTPEGARDYLVPSRLNPGMFYALPQSPQLFKQLFMIAGFNRYFQIVRCFRDEDLRADRQPEFTQLDLEMAFVTPDDIFSIIEDYVKTFMKALMNVDIKTPFPRHRYRDVIDRYGTDKPDLRYDLPHHNVTEILRASAFQVFQETAKNGGLIKALKVDASDLTRKELDELPAVVAPFGAKGVMYIKLNSVADKKAGWQGPIQKFLSDAEKDALTKALELKDGNIVFFIADRNKITHDSMNALRQHLGKRLGMIRNEYNFSWVTDFPLFERDEHGALTSSHHPFTAPRTEDIPKLEQSPDEITSTSYDIVLNGYELGSGSIRIHQTELQAKIFRILGITDDEAKLKFGFLLEALTYGAPPHGGIALGIDRIIFLLTGGDSLRDVIAYPKTQKGQCLMSDAPSLVSTQQLLELGLTTVGPKP